MSLWPLQIIAPCMSYIDYGSCVPPPGPTGGYNKYLITCPRHYQESMISQHGMNSFFYDPGSDKFIYHTWLYKTAWPGWDVKRYEFDAATGAQVGDTYGTDISIWGSVYSKNAISGSYGKVYACRSSEYYIREVSADTLLPVTGGWSVNPYTWTPKSIYFYALVNRIDNYLVAATNWTLDCWRNISTTPERFAQLRLPNVLNSLCYESQKYCWAITQDGVILKADYQIPRWEMISTVQDPSDDAVGYLITYDTKRKRVVVFRQRQDAADGACQHQLEFYYPMVAPAQLTQPVPVTSLRGGNRIILVSHLIGDAGEGLTPYTVNGAMVSPVEGSLVTPFSATAVNGAVGFQYQAPEAACTETLQLAVTVEES